jgi:CRP-like cAMP-binding protein
LIKSIASIRAVKPGEVIYRQSDAPQFAFALISGWAIQHRDLSDGRRQVTQVLVPGAFFGTEPDGCRLSHGVMAVAESVVCCVPVARLAEARRRFPALNERYISLLEQKVRLATDSLAAVGRGFALERVAGALWELSVRVHDNTDLPAGFTIQTPLTQNLLAEATALTPVHVNRMLRHLQEAGVASLHRGVLTILDPDELRAIANADDEAPLLEGR